MTVAYLVTNASLRHGSCGSLGDAEYYRTAALVVKSHSNPGNATMGIRKYLIPVRDARPSPLGN